MEDVMGQNNPVKAPAVDASAPSPQVGDLVVVRGRYGSWEIYGPLTKVTAARAWFERWKGSSGYIDFPDIKFAGSKKAATDLCSVLKGLEVAHAKSLHTFGIAHHERCLRAIQNALRDGVGLRGPTSTVEQAGATSATILDLPPTPGGVG